MAAEAMEEAAARRDYDKKREEPHTATTSCLKAAMISSLFSWFLVSCFAQRCRSG